MINKTLGKGDIGRQLMRQVLSAKKLMMESERSGMAKKRDYKFQFQMKSRLSIEIKGLLEHNKLGGSRCDPECSAALTTASNSTKHLKRSESSSTLRRTDTEISLIEDRYRALEHNYRQLLEETKNKGELFRKQKEEIQRLQEAHQRDQKEIAQLRSLIDIARRLKPTAQENLRQTPHPACPRPDRPVSSAQRKKSPAGKQAGNVSGVGVGLRKSRAEDCWGKYKFVPSVRLQ